MVQLFDLSDISCEMNHSLCMTTTCRKVC
uniref:Uncharacterized protein n=1 Tax=Rhizophora mucronata TaxID=61149 RepID=A0A2P2P1U4_RHIMU